MKLIGTAILIVCGGIVGISLSSAFRERTERLERVSEMLLQMSIMLEHELLTVEQMIGRLSSEEGMPRFLRGAEHREDVLRALSEGCLDRASRERLTAFFRQFGSADKDSEQERLAALRAYFSRRIEIDRPLNEKHAKLAGRLGLLGGIFAAILLI